MRRMLWLLPVVAVLGFGGFALFTSRPEAVLRGPAPEFNLPNLADSDARIALSSFRGRPLVVNFWASWCDPCREEAPELVRARRAFAKRVRFLGVNILDGREEALKYLRTYRIRFPNVQDTRAVVAKRYGVTGAPETVFIDESGNVVGKYIGAFRRGELERLLDELVALNSGEVLRITGRGETRPVP
ncbi:MAG TPA: TlpA disulfide reductase family protein [Actinomycetota bacterium]|jgi:cytochrome c biogenesis protein CcmG/thiol:disulfide interchange protein DsbE|nr:TlpA disulfide reductase family protein [Actinomycetota bacterium]